MLDGIPFGSAGGIVCDRYREAECVAHLRLKFGLPDPGTATVAAARVGQDQQLGNPAPATRSFGFPPGGDGVGGEGCGIVRDADADGAAIAVGVELVAICLRLTRREKSIWYKRRATVLA